MKSWFRTCCIVFLLSLPGRLPGQTTELELLEGVRLVEHASNDGDSFMVEHGGRKFPVRLYFVDCPETSASSETDARRVRSQTRYFGLPEHAVTLRYGRKAREFTSEQLARPFRLHTAFATAPGRSTTSRVYGFIETASGEDLAALLVEHGYARAFGVRRGTPTGIAHDEWHAMLSDLESAAMLERRGIWSEAEARRLVALRAEERRERADLRSIGDDDRQPAPVDLNTASPEALTRLPGVGPVTAGRIISHRPYRDINDVYRVPGISSAARHSLTQYAVWKPAAE